MTDQMLIYTGPHGPGIVEWRECGDVIATSVATAGLDELAAVVLEFLVDEGDLDIEDEAWLAAGMEPRDIDDHPLTAGEIRRLLGGAP